jgi:hypothetical protein
VTEFLQPSVSGGARPLRAVLEDLAAAFEAEVPAIEAELISLRDPTEEKVAAREDRARAARLRQPTTLADLALPRWRHVAAHRTPGDGMHCCSLC